MKPVNKKEFWKDRIEFAEKTIEHYSVFISNEDVWERINRDHEETFKREIKETDKVLDAGCAYGRSSIYFNNYVGVDFSPDFIFKAIEKFPKKKFLVADIKKLPFEDKEFDVAFCISIKAMIASNLGEEEWLKMEKELHRVAKKVLIMEYTGSNEYERWENGETTYEKIK